MDDRNIYAAFSRHFPSNLDNPILETPDGRSWSYADLDRESARIARLLTGLGARPGDRIAAQVEKSTTAFWLYLGCLRAGFIYLPLNTAYTAEELGYFLDNAEPTMLVCASKRLADSEPLARKHGVLHVLDLDSEGGGGLKRALSGVSSEFTSVPRAADDTAVILYTSGTTGRPKGAMITHGNLAANALALRDAWGFGPRDVLLHALPIFHIHGLFVACHCTLLSGSQMIFLDRFDVEQVLTQLTRATVFMGVPTYYTRLLADPRFNRKICSNMRLFTCGSAPLLEQTFLEFEQRTGHRILERYGMTETGMNTSNPLRGARRPGTVGPPLPGVTVQIVGPDGREVRRGEVGQLLVRGDNVFKGYWRMPDKTAEDFTRDGYFRTGDLARTDSHGYVAIVGRSKDMVITGGLNVYPKEIERLIDELDGVVESAVIGLPHPDFGEAVTAIVVPHDETAGPDATAITAALKGSLASYKIPKRVFFIDQLPRNAMGKVQKNVLREQYAGCYSRD